MRLFFWPGFFLCDLRSQCVEGCMSAGFVDDYRDVSVAEEGVDDVDAVPMMQFSEVGAISGLHRAFEGRCTEVGVVLVQNLE